MKALKIVGIVLVLLLVVVIVVPFFAPAKLVVTKSIQIERSAATIFPEVNDFKNWPAWSPWIEKDSTIINEFSGEDSGIGAITSWTSEESGSGKQEIVDSKPNQYIRTALAFDGWDMISHSDWNFEENDGVTTVTWTFDGEEIGWPMRAFNLFVDGALNAEYSRGLELLKAHCEAKPRIVIKNINADVFVSELSQDQYIITMMDSVTPDGIRGVYEASYAAIGQFMEENGIAKEAAPVGIYHLYSDSLVILEAGIPISEKVEVPEGMNMLVIGPTKVASATHVGAWENIGETHDAIGAWIEANKAEMNGAPWHVYFNTLEDVEDPAKLYTQVHYPIK